MFGVFTIFTSSNMQLFWIGFSKPSATPLHTHTHQNTALCFYNFNDMQIKHCLMYFLRKENCYILFRYMSEASMHDLKKNALVLA